MRSHLCPMHHTTRFISFLAHPHWAVLAISTAAATLLGAPLTQAQTPPTILYSDFETPANRQIYSQGYSALKLDDSGSEVEALQNQLASLGYYNGPVTGYFGSLTEEAVIRFQQASGLQADGIAGAETLAALNQGERAALPADVAQPEPFPQPVFPQPAFAQPQTFAQPAPITQFGQDVAPAPFTTARAPLTAEERAREDQLRANIARERAARGNIAPVAPIQQNFTPQNFAQPPFVEPVQQPFARQDFSTFDQPAFDQPAFAVAASSNLLQLGDYGEAVADLQRRLQQRGFYNGEIDGDFGPQTEQAVIAFQRANNLEADGIAGPQTLAALQGGSNPVPPINPPTYPPTFPPTFPPVSSADSGRYSVLDLQERLNRRGFYFGRFDGILGPQTLEAITAAQTSYGLSRGDVLNPF